MKTMCSLQLSTRCGVFVEVLAAKHFAFHTAGGWCNARTVCAAAGDKDHGFCSLHQVTNLL